MQNMNEHTPMMQQYIRIKQEYPDMLVFYRMGDFYELFFQDAEEASQLLSITLTSRNGNQPNPIKMAGIPFHAVEQYLSKLVKLGKSIVIVDQIGEVTGKGLVDRQVTRIITPGTISDELLLDEKSDNVLCAIYLQDNLYGIATLSVASGKFYIQQLSQQQLLNELDRLNPAELIIPESINASFKSQSLVIKSLPDWNFDYQSNYQKLCKHFNIHNLDGFGVTDLHLGIIAGGVLLNYAQQMTRCNLSHITSIIANWHNLILEIDVVSRRNLEINQTLHGNKTPTLLSLFDRCVNVMGSRMLRRWLNNPLQDKSIIIPRQQSVALFINQVDNLSGVLKQCGDIERIVSRIALLSARPRDLSVLRDSLALLSQLDYLKNLNDPLINQLSSTIANIPPEIQIKLAQAIKSEPNITLRDGNIINDGYNQELDHLRNIQTSSNKYLTQLEQQERERTNIATLKIEFNRVHGYYIEVSKTHANKIPDNYKRSQTLKNAERYTTPELKDFEYEILSATDKAIELEKVLYLEILHWLNSFVTELQQLADAIATLDVLNTFAHIARLHNYICPTFTTAHQLSIKQGRHPVIENRVKNFIANDINLLNETNFLLITGPNMGGKSTYMRQTALIIILAHIGSFVPAQEAIIGPIDKIFTRIGSSDDLSEGKSTFMVEMTETANILHNATNNSLVLIDEIGRGTSTLDGLALASSIATYLIEHIQAYTLFATHYFELTNLANNYSMCKNIHLDAVEHDDNIIFMHNVQDGPAAKSYGIQVAQLSGIPKCVITQAQQNLMQLEQNRLPIIQQVTNLPATENLIATADIAPIEQEVIQYLHTLNPDDLNPKQALNILYNIITKIK